MTVERIFFLLAMVFVLGAAALFAYLVVQFSAGIWRIAHSNRRSIDQTGKLLVQGIAIAFGISCTALSMHEYQKAQVTRQAQMKALVGILPSLDHQINASDNQRVSYSHVQRIEREAIAICEAAEDVGAPIASSQPCMAAKSLYASSISLK